MDSDGRLPIVLHYDRRFLFESARDADFSLARRPGEILEEPARGKSRETHWVPGPCAFDLGPYLPATVTRAQGQTVSSELKVTVTPLSPFLLQTGPNSASVIRSRTHRIFLAKGKKRPSKSHLDRLSDKTRADDGGMCNVCRVVPYQFFHFGAFVCNRCRAFFRRCVRRVRSGQHLTACLTTKTRATRLADHTPVCDISVFRGACQICRYVTCLRVGMNTDSVMTDKARMTKYSKKGRDPSAKTGGVQTHASDVQEEVILKACPTIPPGVDDETCPSGNANLVVKLSPLYGPIPDQDESPQLGDADLEAQIEFDPPIPFTLSNLALDAPVHNIYSVVSESHKKLLGTSPRSLEDFLYYCEPLQDPPWCDGYPDSPLVSECAQTGSPCDLFDAPEQDPEGGPQQFHFSDKDYLTDTTSPVDNFNY